MQAALLRVCERLLARVIHARSDAFEEMLSRRRLAKPSHSQPIVSYEREVHGRRSQFPLGLERVARLPEVRHLRGRYHVLQHQD